MLLPFFKNTSSWNIGWLQGKLAVLRGHLQEEQDTKRSEMCQGLSLDPFEFVLLCEAVSDWSSNLAVYCGP